MRIILLPVVLIFAIRPIFAASLQQPAPNPSLPPVLAEAEGPLGFHTGDLEEMQKRRMILAGVFLNKTNYFIDSKGHQVGTVYGNTLVNRYLKNPQFIKNNRSPESIRRFKELGPLFRKYSDQYGLLWLAAAAEAYQESGLDQNARSPSGAIGVMQVMPSTAASPPVNIPDVTKVDRNIEAGVKLLHFIYNEYFKDDPMDPVNKALMTVAAYDAGPARITQCRQLATKPGLDPNLWFNNVEYAVAKRVGSETVAYVSNIYKYYIGCKLHEELLESASGQAGKQPAVNPEPTKKK
jgi:membrane-bound lytic murein transglycosylase MltF